MRVRRAARRLAGCLPENELSLVGGGEACKQGAEEQDSEEEKSGAYIQSRSHGCKYRGGESDWFNNGLWPHGSIENGKHVCGERKTHLRSFQGMLGVVNK